MALLADKSADVNSNLVSGNNTQSLTFTMPGGVAMKVLSVVATVTNGAGSAVTPELTIKDQSGVVIAARKQSSSIPAGDTGTATWALRLDDDSAGTSPGGSGIQFDTDPQSGGFLTIETTGFDPVTGNGVDFNVTGTNDMVVHLPSSGGGVTAAFVVDVDGLNGEFLIRYNRAALIITTGEGIDINPGEIDIDVATNSFIHTTATGGTQIKCPNLGGTSLTSPAGTIFRVDDNAGTNRMAFFGGTQRAQFTAITAPAGGATVDTEARTAIQAILNVLGAAAGGYGLTT